MFAKFNANLLQNRQARCLILSKFDEIFKKSATNICVEFCKFVKSSARQIRFFPSSKLYLGIKARNAKKNGRLPTTSNESSVSESSRTTATPVQRTSSFSRRTAQSSTRSWSPSTTSTPTRRSRCTPMRSPSVSEKQLPAPTCSTSLMSDGFIAG